MSPVLSGFKYDLFINNRFIVKKISSRFNLDFPVTPGYCLLYKKFRFLNKFMLKCISIYRIKYLYVYLEFCNYTVFWYV